jgi:hypothetical protein
MLLSVGTPLGWSLIGSAQPEGASNAIIMMLGLKEPGRQEEAVSESQEEAVSENGWRSTDGEQDAQKPVQRGSDHRDPEGTSGRDAGCDLSRGISDATVYTWREKFGGMEASDARSRSKTPSSRRSSQSLYSMSPRSGRRSEGNVDRPAPRWNVVTSAIEKGCSRGSRATSSAWGRRTYRSASTRRTTRRRARGRGRVRRARPQGRLPFGLELRSRRDAKLHKRHRRARSASRRGESSMRVLTRPSAWSSSTTGPRPAWRRCGVGRCAAWAYGGGCTAAMGNDNLPGCATPRQNRCPRLPERPDRR